MSENSMLSKSNDCHLPNTLDDVCANQHFLDNSYKIASTYCAWYSTHLCTNGPGLVINFTVVCTKLV